LHTYVQAEPFQTHVLVQLYTEHLSKLTIACEHHGNSNSFIADVPVLWWTGTGYVLCWPPHHFVEGWWTRI